MGGGRDNSGAALYKRVDGKYIRIGAYKDKEKEANRLISEIFDRPIDKETIFNYTGNLHGYRDKDAVIVSKRPIAQRAILSYIQAIDKRDRNAVISLDEKLKKGLFGTGEEQQKISNIRKALLDIARESPEKITDIHKSVVNKTMKTITDKEKLHQLEKRYIGKKLKLIDDVMDSGSESASIRAYYPTGLVGTALKFREKTFSMPWENKTFVLYDVLLQWEDGYKKWIPSSAVEAIS